MSEQVSMPEVLPADEAVAVPVGQQLRQAREARGLSVADIAQTLKLGQRQVAWLEADDWSSLPGQTFVRGFIRNYARLVHLDAAPLMAQLDRLLERPASNLEVPESRPAEIEHGGFSSGSSRKDRQVMLVGAGLLAAAALAYVLMPNDLSALRDSAQALLDSLGRKEAPAAAPVPAVAEPVFPPGSTPQQVMNPQVLTPAEPPAAKGPEALAPAAQMPAVPPQASAVPPAAPAPGAAQMRFVADKAAWIEVRDRDNKVIFSQRLAAGAEQVLSGSGPLSIVVGYAPGVRLFWHGEAIDLAPHTKGDVARLVLE